jgi:TBC1 domain family member 15
VFVHSADRGFKFFAKEKGVGVLMLRNVLLTYVMHNFDLGYCQGMSDLVAPLL